MTSDPSFVSSIRIIIMTESIARMLDFNGPGTAADLDGLPDVGSIVALPLGRERLASVLARASLSQTPGRPCGSPAEETV